MNGKDRLASLKTDRDRLKRELLATTRSNTKLLEHVSVLTKRRIELERHLLEASTACHGRGEHKRRGVDDVKPRLARQRAEIELLRQEISARELLDEEESMFMLVIHVLFAPPFL